MQLLVRVCNYDRMNFERLAARAFVVLGGAFWIVAAFGADFAFRDKSVLASATSAMLPLGIALVAFLIGLFYERLAALLLGIGVVAAIVWGLVAGWETGVWVFTTAVLIAPMAISALLFLLASQTQLVCSLDE